MSERGLLVTGCGRSGTTYTAKLLQTLGLKFGHERLGMHGIASWYLGSKQKKVPFGPSMQQLAWLDLPVVHQVREPLSAISSCLAIGKSSRRFLEEESAVFRATSRIGFAMRYWLYWNQTCEQLGSFTYQIERLDETLPKVLAIGKLDLPESHRSSEVSKKTNARTHTSLTWDQLFDEDPVLATEIRELGGHYGYH